MVPTPPELNSITILSSTSSKSVRLNIAWPSYQYDALKWLNLAALPTINTSHSRVTYNKQWSNKFHSYSVKSMASSAKPSEIFSVVSKLLIPISSSYPYREAYKEQTCSVLHGHIALAKKWRRHQNITKQVEGTKRTSENNSMPKGASHPLRRPST